MINKKIDDYLKGWKDGEALVRKYFWWGFVGGVIVGAGLASLVL